MRVLEIELSGSIGLGYLTPKYLKKKSRLKLEFKYRLLKKLKSRIFLRQFCQITQKCYNVISFPFYLKFKYIQLLVRSYFTKWIYGCLKNIFLYLFNNR